MDSLEIIKRLQRFYQKHLAWGILAVLGAFMLRQLGLIKTVPLFTTNLLMILTATLSALTAIALPILYRSYFVDQVKGRKKLAINEFLAFEQKTISIALATPFLLALAILTGMNRTTLVMITFFTLYAIYFFYPSSKKVEFEMKFFRIIPYKKPKKK